MNNIKDSNSLIFLISFSSGNNLNGNLFIRHLSTRFSHFYTKHINQNALKRLVLINASERFKTSTTIHLQKKNNHTKKKKGK